MEYCGVKTSDDREIIAWRNIGYTTTGLVGGTVVGWSNYPENGSPGCVMEDILKNSPI